MAKQPRPEPKTPSNSSSGPQAPSNDAARRISFAIPPHARANPVRAYAASLQPLPDLLAPETQSLLVELAAELRPAEEIIAGYDMPLHVLQRLLQHPQFVGMLKEAKERFNSVANTADRIRLKAQLATELAMQSVYAITADPAQPAAARVSAYRALTALTGLERPEAHAPGSQFILKINLTDPATNSARTLTIEGEASVPMPADPSTLDPSAADQLPAA